MRVLFQLGHPAHFHLFKNTIAELQRDGHATYILIRKKDILEDLLEASGLSYTNILPSGKKSVFTLMLRLWRVFWFAISHRVNVLVGSTPEVAQVAWMNRGQIKELFDADMFVETLEYFFTEVAKQ